MLVNAHDENQEFLEKKLVKQFDYMTWHELLVLMFTTFFLSLQSNYRIKNVKKECKATCPQPAIASCIGVIDIRYFQSSKLCPMVQVQVWWIQNSYGRIPLSVSDKWDNTGGNFLKFNGLTCASLARHHQHAWGPARMQHATFITAAVQCTLKQAAASQASCSGLKPSLSVTQCWPGPGLSLAESSVFWSLIGQHLSDRSQNKGHVMFFTLESFLLTRRTPAKIEEIHNESSPNSWHINIHSH